MSIFKKAIDALTGNLPGILSGAIDKLIPDPTQKAELKLEMTRLIHQHEIDLLEAAGKADAEFNRRVLEHEGTAADLKGIPIIGPIIILLRGLIRPAFTLAVLWWDFKAFGGEWDIAGPQTQAFFTINLIVVGFWFGERALKNVAPHVTKFVTAKNGNGKG